MGGKFGLKLLLLAGSLVFAAFGVVWYFDLIGPLAICASTQVATLYIVMSVVNISVGTSFAC